MGIDGIFGKVEEIGKEIFSYFNAFGRFYIQVQILCRLLVVNVFLDDLFGGPDLTCDTKQVGCQQNCINRFAPINHQKLWEFEFFLVMLCLVFFSLFAMFNKYAYKKWLADMKKQDSDSAPTIVAAKSMGIRFTNNKGVPIYDIANAQEEDLGTSLVNSNKPAKFDDTPFSKVVQIGYVCMLILRVGIEWFSLNLELNLGRHQSQKGGLIDSLKLKEMWYCPTNTEGSDESIAEFFPPQNRSIFWTDELNEPCVQQKVYIACWIPFSRMKTWGMYFMYYVLIMCFVITVLELCLALYDLCTRFGNKSQMAFEKESQAAIRDHKRIYDRKTEPVSVAHSIVAEESMEKRNFNQDTPFIADATAAPYYDQADQQFS